MRSKEGKGSTFWVELPLGIGKKTCLTDPRVAHENSGTTPPDESAPTQGPVSQRLRPQGTEFDPLTVAESSAKAVAPIPLQAPPHVNPPDVALPMPVYKGDQGPIFAQMPSGPTFKVSASQPSLDDNSESTYSHNTNPANDSFLSKLRLFDRAHAPKLLSSSFTGIEPGLPVLVVDDDSLTRTLMKRILTRLGCEVSTAENGEVALELILGIQVKRSLSLNAAIPIPEQVIGATVFDEGRFAVIFLDNQMPLMSGLKVAEKLRKHRRHDFIVGVTGWCLL